MSAFAQEMEAVTALRVAYPPQGEVSVSSTLECSGDDFKDWIWTQQPVADIFGMMRFQQAGHSSFIILLEDDAIRSYLIYRASVGQYGLVVIAKADSSQSARVVVGAPSNVPGVLMSVFPALMSALPAAGTVPSDTSLPPPGTPRLSPAASEAAASTLPALSPAASEAAAAALPAGTTLDRDGNVIQVGSRVKCLQGPEFTVASIEPGPIAGPGAMIVRGPTDDGAEVQYGSRQCQLLAPPALSAAPSEAAASEATAGLPAAASVLGVPGTPALSPAASEAAASEAATGLPAAASVLGVPGTPALSPAVSAASTALPAAASVLGVPGTPALSPAVSVAAPAARPAIPMPAPAARPAVPMPAPAARPAVPMPAPAVAAAPSTAFPALPIVPLPATVSSAAAAPISAAPAKPSFFSRMFPSKPAAAAAPTVPLDKNGNPIRVGDTVTCKEGYLAGETFVVDRYDADVARPGIVTVTGMIRPDERVTYESKKCEVQPRPTAAAPATMAAAPPPAPVLPSAMPVMASEVAPITSARDRNGETILPGMEVVCGNKKKKFNVESFETNFGVPVVVGRAADGTVNRFGANTCTITKTQKPGFLSRLTRKNKPAPTRGVTLRVPRQEEPVMITNPMIPRPRRRVIAAEPPDEEEAVVAPDATSAQYQAAAMAAKARATEAARAMPGPESVLPVGTSATRTAVRPDEQFAFANPLRRQPASNKPIVASAQRLEQLRQIPGALPRIAATQRRSGRGRKGRKARRTRRKTKH